MDGNASEVETAGVLVALRTKGETVEELEGLARTMRAFAVPVTARRDDLIDTAGTGGGRPTFNVSTTAALIATGAGCAVAKHGNRSATGLSGSADLLEALGVRIDLAPDAVARCIEEVGFGFMFAPAHHGATRFVVPVRKELAVRTIFNFLGPLTNPAGATRQVIGVSDPAFMDTIAGALARLGAEKALVVSSADGLDEMSTSGTTRVVEVDGTELRRYEVAPEDVGLARAQPDSLVGGTPADNAATTRRILAGEPGPERDLALINAGAAVYVSGRVADLAAGVAAAAEAVDSGAAARSARRAHPAHAGSSRPHERARAHRRRHPRGGPPPPRAGPDRAPGGGAGRPARGPPVPGGAHPPRHLGDRRAQAPLALGRDDPRRRQRDRGRAGLRARRRGRALDPHRAVPLRRLARRPARGARRDRAARAAQGLHRRRLPARRGGGGGGRRDPADRRRAGPRRALRPAARGARARPRRGGGGPRRARAGGRARRRGRRARAQQPRPRGLLGRPRAHLRAALRRPGGQDRRLRVGLLLARRARRARGGRRRRGADRRDADARAGDRGRLPRAHRRRRRER